MFGYYTNIQLNENERKILKSAPDDYEWYMAMIKGVFNDERMFEVREDIKVPDDGDGVVIIFERGCITYFKTIRGTVTVKELEKVSDACSYLEKEFKSDINSYVLCTPQEVDYIQDMDNTKHSITISQIRDPHGEETIEKLENKLINNIPYTYEDSINHFMLPFLGWPDTDSYREKYEQYMKLVNSYDGDWNNEFKTEI